VTAPKAGACRLVTVQWLTVAEHCATLRVAVGQCRVAPYLLLVAYSHELHGLLYVLELDLVHVVHPRVPSASWCTSRGRLPRSSPCPSTPLLPPGGRQQVTPPGRRREGPLALGIPLLPPAPVPPIEPAAEEDPASPDFVGGTQSLGRASGPPGGTVRPWNPSRRSWMFSR